MANAIMVSIRPEQIDLICGAGARVPVGKGYTVNRGDARKLYLYCAEGADRQVWIGPEHAYVDDHAHAETDVCGRGKVIGECLYLDLLPFGAPPEGTGLRGVGLPHDALEWYWHGRQEDPLYIVDLLIYEQPKELEEFAGAELPPQDWCFVKELGSADFIIFLRPDEIAFTCPHCAAYVEIPWGDVEDETPDDWGGGDWPDVVCPECKGKVSLDKDPLMWKKVKRSQRWEEKHDLISRKAAIDAILSEPPEAHYPSWYEGVVRNLPAADVEPVRRGWWIPVHESEITGFTPELAGRDPIGGYKCSECGKFAISDCNDEFVLADYCPHCGAKMDGGMKNERD